MLLARGQRMVRQARGCSFLLRNGAELGVQLRQVGIQSPNLGEPIQLLGQRSGRDPGHIEAGGPARPRTSSGTVMFTRAMRIKYASLGVLLPRPLGTTRSITSPPHSHHWNVLVRKRRGASRHNAPVVSSAMIIWATTRGTCLYCSATGKIDGCFRCAAGGLPRWPDRACSGERSVPRTPVGSKVEHVSALAAPSVRRTSSESSWSSTYAKGPWGVAGPARCLVSAAGPCGVIAGRRTTRPSEDVA